MPIKIKAILILINTAAFALIAAVFWLFAHSGSYGFGLTVTFFVWLIYSVIYSAIGYAVFKDKSISDVKFSVFAVLSVIAATALFIISAVSRDLHASYFETALIIGEFVFLAAVVIDWCISVGVSIIARRVFDRKSGALPKDANYR